MEQKHIDGFVDYFNQQAVALEAEGNLEPCRYRVKMKEGVTSLSVAALGDLVWAVDRGLGAGVERGNQSGLPCGQYVTIYLTPGSYSFRYGDFVRPAELGAFLSQFEVVYDPLPEYIYFLVLSGSITVASPKFTVKTALFDNCSWAHTDVNFKGSTFETAPRLFTEECMAEFQKFPINETNSVWAPFAGCPSIKKIENQGTFGDFLDYLGPCDFSFTREDGFDSLEGYPSGGNPIFINQYVRAKKVHLGETFPIIGNERLKRAIKPFILDEVSIDTVGLSMTFPFGGIDYYGTELDKFYLHNPKFTVDLPDGTNINKNFSFGWGNLGIVAPSTCQDIINLNTIWQNWVDPEKPMGVATPDFLEAQALYFWGHKLHDYSLTRSEAFTSDFMPVLPSGSVLRHENYYTKIIIGMEDDMVKEPRMASLAMPLELDGVPHAYAVQPLPEGLRFANGYCHNLYAHNEINSDIIIPALPASTEFARNAYRRTFYSAIGPEDSIEPSIHEPTVMIAYSVSQSSGLPPINVIATPDGSYVGTFRDIMDNPDNEVYITQWNAFSNTAIQTEDWVSYIELIAGIKRTGSAEVVTRVFQNNITLEKRALPNLEGDGTFMEECWFGAGVDPTTTDCLVPAPQSQEWNNYRRALNIYIGASFNEPQVYWKGRVRIKADLTHSVRYLDFVAMVTYGVFDVAQFADYIYNIDSVIMSGSPRTEGTTVIKPYREFLSPQTIQGDPTAFMATHGIVLTDPDTFSTGVGTAITDFVTFRGSPMGWNGNYYYDAEQAAVDARRTFNFYVSYQPKPDPRFGQNNLEPNSENNFYFSRPFWIDTYVMRGKAWAEYQITSQSTLDSAMVAINTP